MEERAKLLFEAGNLYSTLFLHARKSRENRLNTRRMPYTLTMKRVPTGYCTEERRLIYKGDIGQLGSDIKDFHVRTDGPIEMAGSVVMAPAVGFTKLGNAVVGHFSDQEAEPLKEGGLKYISRDFRSAGKNLLATGKNLVTLHPLRALGNAAKTLLDGTDIVFVDPFLDVGSGAFGHNRRQISAATRSDAQYTLAS